VFVIDIVQEVITFLQFVVVLAFLAALLWLFRPAQDSPYLLMGDGTDTLDTALGVDEEEDTPTLLEDSRCVLQHISVASNSSCHDDQLRR
jgi:hypothetical protein